MRNDLAKTEIIIEPARFHELMMDHKIEVSLITPCQQHDQSELPTKTDFIQEHSSSNSVISMWTTSAARLKLYSYMRQVDDAPGCRLLYTDTDSVIYEHPDGQNPLTTGEHLGEMSMEYTDYAIEDYVSIFFIIHANTSSCSLFKNNDYQIVIQVFCDNARRRVLLFTPTQKV
uniref:DNA-directed DNA polymerase n=1 Tax=Ditylenchus dipsaci TaxID=166011 RepID=A0A915DQ17_9BILA